MWDAIAANLRIRLREDPSIAARGAPQRRKAVDCRRRWDHVLKKAHSTPVDKLNGEQKLWLKQFSEQRSLMGGPGGSVRGKPASTKNPILSIPEDREVSDRGSRFREEV